MPNWCMNNLTVTHPDSARLQEFCDAYNAGHVFRHYIPQPESLPAGEVVALPDGTPVKTMSDDQLSWRLAHWGTKWDLDAPDTPVSVSGDRVSVSFDTAWSPPVPFYQHLETLGYGVRGSYFEPGVGFCGVYENGDDDYYASAPDDAPASLADEFNMQDFYEED